ncbi:UNVERIFIED_CONTAM: hypothetical protein RKD43_007119 [Streptomyces graminofaciens]
MGAQGLGDHVGPVGAARAQVFELGGPGEQGGDRVADQVAGGLLAGADHQVQGRDQFLFAQPFPAVAGGDQRGGQVGAGLGAPAGDQRGQQFGHPVLGPGHLVGRYRGAQGGVDRRAQGLPVGSFDTEQFTDHPHRQQFRERRPQIHHPLTAIGTSTGGGGGGGGGHLVQQGGGDPFDPRRQFPAAARGERAGHQPPQPGVFLPVGEQHRGGRHPVVQRPLRRDPPLDERRPVPARVLGDPSVRQQPLERLVSGHRPRPHPAGQHHPRGRPPLPQHGRLPRQITPRHIERVRTPHRLPTHTRLHIHIHIHVHVHVHVRVDLHGQLPFRPGSLGTRAPRRAPPPCPPPHPRTPPPEPKVPAPGAPTPPGRPDDRPAGAAQPNPTGPTQQEQQEQRDGGTRRDGGTGGTAGGPSSCANRAGRRGGGRTLELCGAGGWVGGRGAACAHPRDRPHGHATLQERTPPGVPAPRHDAGHGRRSRPEAACRHGRPLPRRHQRAPGPKGPTGGAGAQVAGPLRGARARQRWRGQGGPGTRQAPNTRASAPRTDPPAGTRANGEQAAHALPKGAGRPCTRPGVGAARPRTGGAGHGPRSGPARPRRSATTKPGARRRRHRTAGAARKTGPGPGTAATSTAELPHPSGRRTQPGPQAGRPTPRQRRTGKCPQPRPRPGHGRRSGGTKTRPPPKPMGRGSGRNRTRRGPHPPTGAAQTGTQRRRSRPPGPAGGRVHDRCRLRGRWAGAGPNDRGRPGIPDRGKKTGEEGAGDGAGQWAADREMPTTPAPPGAWPAERRHEDTAASQAHGARPRPEQNEDAAAPRPGRWAGA